MASNTLAGRMRAAAQQLNKFRAADLAEAVEVQTYKERSRVSDYVRDFHKRGEFVRIARGLYQYRAVPKRRTRMDIVWHLVRSHRHFGLDEMDRLSGASRGTVKEYLRCLVSLGYLEKAGRSRWRLVNDPGPDTPVNTGKCARLKRLRRA